jgi:hypothetical protein
MMMLGIAIKAFDQTGGVFGRVAGRVGQLQQRLEKIQQSSERFGRGLLADGLIAAGAMQAPIRSFANLEAASTQLQNTLMRKDGSIPAIFQKIDAQAKKLGNRLPGTTEDFYAMASSLNAMGVSAETVAGGALEATAYLGVVSKPLGVSYEQSAEAVAKFSNALGIADKDMVAFADTVQRAEHIGARLTEMQYAFSRVSAPLKIVGAQGLQTANQLTPLVAMLFRVGKTGEEAGTGLKKIMEVAISKGKWKDIPTLVADLEKYQKLKPEERLRKLEAVFGKEAAGIAAVIAAGGYKKIAAEMEAQASLTQRVGKSLGTLANLWEAASGTFTNLMAAFGETFAPELKLLTGWFNSLSESVMGFVQTHPRIAKYIGLAVGGFGLLAISLGGAGLAVAGVARYLALVAPIVGWVGKGFGLLASMSGWLARGLLMAGKSVLLLGRFLLMSPIGLAITAIAVAAFLIYKYWGPISTFFGELWDSVVKKYNETVASVSLGIETLAGYFSGLADSIRNFIGGAIDWVSEKWTAFTGMLSGAASVIGGLFGASPSLPKPPPQTIASQVSAPQVSPAITEALPPPALGLPEMPALQVATPKMPAFGAGPQIVMPKAAPQNMIAQVAAPEMPAFGAGPQIVVPQVPPALIAAGPRIKQAPTLGGPAPVLRGAGEGGKKEKVEVGGELRIKIDSEGRPSITKMTASNPKVPLDVDAGIMGAGVH